MNPSEIAQAEFIRAGIQSIRLQMGMTSKVVRRVRVILEQEFEKVWEAYARVNTQRIRRVQDSKLLVNALEAARKRALRRLAGELRELEQDLRDQGTLDVMIGAKALETATEDDEDTSIITPGRVAAGLGIATLLVEGESLRRAWRRIAGNARRRVEQALNRAVLRNLSAAGGRREGRRALRTIATQAGTLARTAAKATQMQARRILFESNSDFIRAVRWVSILDLRTSDVCKALDGKTWTLEDARYPPAHHQALATGTLITTERGQVPIEDVRVGDLVLTHAGRWRPVYTCMSRPAGSERMWALHTASGRILRGTDEHPVLTTRGWVEVRNLKVGDQVFQNIQQVPRPGAGAVPTQQGVLIDAHNRPTEISEPRVPFDVSVTTRGVSASVQLQADLMGRPGKVNIEMLDGILRDDSRAEKFESLDQLSDSLGGHDIQWYTAEITEISELPNTGRVWNLAVEQDETYVAEGIVVHNCRSEVVPILLGSRARPMRTYGEWLRTQSREVQDEVLGPQRAALFRRGQIDVRRFVDSDYRPLTVDQILRREGLTRQDLVRLSA